MKRSDLNSIGWMLWAAAHFLIMPAGIVASHMVADKESIAYLATLIVPSVLLVLIGYAIPILLWIATFFIPENQEKKSSISSSGEPESKDEA